MFILCGAGEFEQCRVVDPSRSELDWVEVTEAEAALITDNVRWQTVDNPAYGQVIGQRETPTGVTFERGEPNAAVIEDIIEVAKRAPAVEVAPSSGPTHSECRPHPLPAIL